MDDSRELVIHSRVTRSVDRNWDMQSLIYPDQFHNSSEIDEEIASLASAVPDLIDVSVIGQSIQGKNLSLVRITNEASNYQKAGVFFCAQHHAREPATVEIILRFMIELVNNYGIDETITSYVDTLEIFIIPTLNPDSNDIVIDGGNERLRKNMRRIDDDGDGSFDEDDYDDVNGDGVLSSFEVYEKNGDNVNFLYQYIEGIDNDGDGLINEDIVGGIDLNRNYEYNWNGFNNDAGMYAGTEMSDTYPGTAPFSEPETAALRDFVLGADHKFAAAMTLHTGINATFFTHEDEPVLYGQLSTDLINMLPDHFFNAGSNIITDIECNTAVEKPVKKDEPSHTYGGFMRDWMYHYAGCKVPLTFEIYRNASSTVEGIHYNMIEDNSTHQVWEWTGMYGYFSPEEGPAINDLWEDVKPAIEYWLEITPRVNIDIITYRVEGTKVTLYMDIANLSPRLDTQQIINIADGPDLLTTINAIDPLGTTSTPVIINLPASLTENLTVLIGNDYVGLHEYVLEGTGSNSSETGTTETTPVTGFMISAVLAVIPLLMLKSWRRER